MNQCRKAVVLACAVAASALPCSAFDVSGIEALISRVAGSDAASMISLSVMQAPDGTADSYTVDGGGPGKNVTIQGSSPVALASGFRRYLRDAANCSVGWAGSQLHGLVRSGPGGKFLPAVAVPIASSTSMRWRQWGNVVVHSYTAAFWDQARWDKELDLMAMRGYNLALAFTGQEAVWATVLKGLGLDEADLAPFFTGPAFLAWGGPRMGNIRGWKGPLAPAWREGQLKLGQHLVGRMAELGITAALPMFAGHVPMALAAKRPEANITRSTAWAGFNCTYSCVGLLSPSSPLFADIVSRTVAAFKKAFGASLPSLAGGPTPPGALPDHVWQFDMYNELLPSSNASDYLRSQANATFAPLEAADPGAVWMLQGWMFSFSSAFWVPRAIKAYISGVPPGRLLVLDLDAYLDPLWRDTDGFYGAPFLWGMINDGGQRPGLFGNLTRVATGPGEAQQAHPSNMQGVCFAPEGLNVNPVLYELLADVVWGDVPPAGMGAWLRRYATARYGLDLPATGAALPASSGVPAADGAAVLPLLDRDASLSLVAAWDALAVAVYNETSEESGSLVEGFPQIGSGPGFGWSDTKALASAWRLILDAVGRTVATRGPGAVSPLLLFDAVDVARQVTVNTAEDLAGLLTGASNRTSVASVRGVASAASRVLSLLDGTLAAHPSFSLAPWRSGAATLCGSYGGDALAADCVTNALWQITLWGAVEPGDAGANLDTYAGKQWSGAVELYQQRWGVLFKAAEAAAEAGTAVNNSAAIVGMVEATVAWASNASAGPAPGLPDPRAFVEAAGSFADEFGGTGEALASFRALPDTDATGQICPTPTGTRDPVQMAALCLADPECGGFNANGWLKARDAPRVPFPGSTLWVRV